MGLNAPIHEVNDAGWHFTSLGSWKDYRAKVDAFSHEELKTSDIYTSENAYHTMIRDITEPINLSELPRYLSENKSLFERFLAP